MKPRFLLDEHMNKAIQRQLYRMAQDIDVLAVGDANAPPKGTSDAELLIWMEANGYILVTENRSTIPVHIAEHFSAGRHFPGVFWIRPNVSIGVIVEELYLIWLASEAEEYLDNALYIPL
ncbi:MAG: hypothetical protein GY749_32785 [Desulfobacteraceae bacterium]|nr:hypothetical protein [Desulfobacteraceae bacterium]